MERIGIIGGSGVYELPGLVEKEKLSLTTPFGEPSGAFSVAEFQGREVVFLPRHGVHHSLSPSSINYRANIYGMKKLNVGWIISVSACGSLKEELKPLDFVVPLQFVDRTNQARTHTFFDQGLVVHVGFSQPVCSDIAQKLYHAGKKVEVNIHLGGTYINIEGPHFSTRAESHLYRTWGMDIIGMTNMVEARLAREAEICYASLAAVTDYDCWHETEETVTVDVILDNLKKNVTNAKRVLQEVIPNIPSERLCPCSQALKNAIVTPQEFIPQEVKDKLEIIAGKYLKK